MKTFGLILIIFGFIMLVIQKIGFTKEEKLVDTSLLEISTKEHTNPIWPYYIGAVFIVGGIILIYADGKKK
ncbi:MAG: hypothetical protein NVS1B13_20120 [Flavisolibacter sp.]